MEIPNRFLRYLPVYPQIEDWGARVLDAGFTKVPPDSEYPAPGHPDSHHFCWEKGRRLHAYTFVYITAGHGVFESESSGPLPISPGNVFILFPGVWHRYRPSVETGWDEYWVECEGTLLDGTMERSGFTASRPVIEVGHDDLLLGTFLEIFEAMRTEPPGFQAVIGLQSLLIVARVRSLMMTARTQGCTEEEKRVRQAIHRMLEMLGGSIDWEIFSQQLGTSYSSFRRTFRRVTGKSPGDYFIRMKINRAKQLLENPSRSVQEISDLLGFESASYFSNLFKKRVGVAPSAYRSQK